MSEEAKEKAGGGKAAHRKKKGKKVGDNRVSFPCFGVLLFIYSWWMIEYSKYEAVDCLTANRCGQI